MAVEQSTCQAAATTTSQVALNLAAVVSLSVLNVIHGKQAFFPHLLNLILHVGMQQIIYIPCFNLFL